MRMQNIVSSIRNGWMQDFCGLLPDLWNINLPMVYRKKEGQKVFLYPWKSVRRHRDIGKIGNLTLQYGSMGWTAVPGLAREILAAEEEDLRLPSGQMVPLSMEYRQSGRSEKMEPI